MRVASCDIISSVDRLKSTDFIHIPTLMPDFIDHFNAHRTVTCCSVVRCLDGIRNTVSICAVQYKVGPSCPYRRMLCSGYEQAGRVQYCTPLLILLSLAYDDTVLYFIVISFLQYRSTVLQRAQ